MTKLVARGTPDGHAPARQVGRAVLHAVGDYEPTALSRRPSRQRPMSTERMRPMRELPAHTRGWSKQKRRRCSRLGAANERRTLADVHAESNVDDEKRGGKKHEHVDVGVEEHR